MRATCIPSISQRSPTSNGCMTNKKMIASNMVLQVFPKINATTTIWELRKMKNLLEAIPNTISHKINIRMPNMTFTMWCSLSTAVLVSFSVKARALRSLNALTWTEGCTIMSRIGGENAKALELEEIWSEIGSCYHG